MNFPKNKPYSGTEVIKDYGKKHLEEGGLIVYTSADSVFQIAAHEDIVPVEKLYEYCQIARDMLKDDLGVGRVIARPFVGEIGNFERTRNRHDFSLEPQGPTIMDTLVENDYDSIGVGKIYDIFAGKSVKETHPMKDNKDGMDITIKLMDKDFKGLCFVNLVDFDMIYGHRNDVDGCFVNLVDFDMIYGHRNDVDGYANAMTEFDQQLGLMMEKLKDDDIVIITADHGCDPSTPSTDHSREYVPMLVFGKDIKEGINLGERKTFADIGKTIGQIFGL
ncbi:MAG: phosphopentomutase, partial [Anaerococcus hydrogenalis]|nr:phosphopentomutase [Anaerococcus hydrogenalis]